MRIGRGTGLSLAALLAGCGQGGGSGVNPLNWFSNAPRVVTMEAPPADDIADPRPLVDQVLSLAVEPMPGGAIVRATGLSPTQGWWAAELVPGPDGDQDEGRLSYRFVIIPPPGPTRVSTQQSREVTAAVFVSGRDLEGVREITVVGARGARSTRR